MLRSVLVWALVGACAQRSSVMCDDGRVCPASTVCDTVHGLCVLPEQVAACIGLGDGATCSAGDLFGQCNAGFCIPGCGDGMINVAGEECDDGNRQSNDGCSQSCTLESAQWRQWTSSWPKRVSHTAAYDTQRERLVVVGGSGESGLLEGGWERTAGLRDHWEPTAGPPARAFAAMAYDPIREVIVLFGGQLAGVSGSDETWELSATGWAQRNPAVSPPGRQGAAMAFDASRGRIVLFGGSRDGGPTLTLGDTWEYDGTAWTPIASTLTPPKRMWPSLAFDEGRARTVLFGGCDNAAPKNDTWELVGGQWASVSAASAPTARCGAAFAYSLGRERLVLHGGLRSSAVDASDTWEYGATGWTQLAFATTPPARRYHTLTYDVSAEALVLVAGTSGGNTPFADVWELTWIADQWEWRQRDLAFSPATRLTVLAPFPPQDQVLLFSGGSSNNSNDTWVFGSSATGLGWRPLAPATKPAWRSGHALVYDSHRERIVMFGGNGDVRYDETWEWNGTDWQQRSTPNAPPARNDMAMAYDPDRRVVVMFGGLDQDGVRDDTWEYDGTDWFQRAPVTRPAAQAFAVMAFDVRGRRVVLFGVDGTTWAYGDGEWLRLETTAQPPERHAASLVSDAALGLTLLAGGVNTSMGNLVDMWSLADDDWHEVAIAGDSPPGRIFGAHAVLAPQRALVMFGGISGAALLGDTWLFRFE